MTIASTLCTFSEINGQAELAYGWSSNIVHCVLLAVIDASSASQHITPHYLCENRIKLLNNHNGNNFTFAPSTPMSYFTLELTVNVTRYSISNHSLTGGIKTSRPAIAGNPRCSVFKLGPKHNCEKRASNIALSYGVDVDK